MGILWVGAQWQVYVRYQFLCFAVLLLLQNHMIRAGYSRPPFLLYGDISLLLFLTPLILLISSQGRQETKVYMDNNERFWVLAHISKYYVIQKLSFPAIFPCHETPGYKKVLKYLRTKSFSENFIKIHLPNVSIHTPENYMPSIDLISKHICWLNKRVREWINDFNDMSNHQLNKHMNWLRIEVSIYLMIKNKNLVWDLERRELTWIESEIVSSSQFRFLQDEAKASLS